MTYKLDYFYGNERLSARFFRIPKALLSGDCTLSVEAVTLYGLLLDRVGLSAQNRWADSKGRVYIYFVLKEVQKCLHCGHNKATKLLRELERYGLIERILQGLGKPAKIYVKNFSSKVNQSTDVSENTSIEPVQSTQNSPETELESCSETDAKDNHKIESSSQPKAESKSRTPAFTAFFSTSQQALKSDQNGQSGMPEISTPKCPKEAANETEKKETDFIETNPSIPQPPYSFGKQSGYRKSRMDEIGWIEKEIRENIDYEILITDHPADKDLFDGYISLMSEACCTSRNALRICGEDLPATLVRKRFLSLNREHILYVRDCISNTVNHIGNIKAYILAALYNAPATMDQYYAAMVSRDMSGCC